MRERIMGPEEIRRARGKAAISGAETPASTFAAFEARAVEINPRSAAAVIRRAENNRSTSTGETTEGRAKTAGITPDVVRLKTEGRIARRFMADRYGMEEV